MKINIETKEQSFGFGMPEKGEYIAQIQEGIQIYDKEDSGAVSIGIPTVLVEVWTKGKKPGKEESVSSKYTHFINILNRVDKKIHDFGCDQIENLIVFCGLSGKFMEKFKDYDDVKTLVKKDLTSLAEFLQLYCVDKVLGIEIQHRKNQLTGDLQARTGKWWALDSVKTAEAGPKVSEDDWG